MTLSPALKRSALLAFASGFVDSAAFLHMGGLFVAHVTGNFVLLGAHLAAGGSGKARETASLLQLASLPVFFGAVVATGILVKPVNGKRPSRSLIQISATLVLLASSQAVVGKSGDAPAALLLIVAMAILNAAQRLDPELGPPFTVMTGNVTGLGLQLARHLGEDRLRLLGKPDGLLLVLGFALGCASGAAGDVWLGWLAMPIPALALGLAAARR